MTTPDVTPSAPAAYTPTAAAIRGRFLWYELTTPDAQAAIAFYRGVVGWSTMQFPGMEPPYHMFMLGETPTAGIWALTDEMKAQGVPPNWMPYIGTESVDATTEAATALGASVLLPATDIPGVGRVGVLADPQGATFGLYQPADAPMPEAEPGVGELSWNELCTEDHRTAFDFYERLFGWRISAEHEMQPGWIYTLFARGETEVGGMFSKVGPTADAPTHWQVYVRVDDVAAAVDTVKRLGGSLLMGPHEVPGGDTIANVMDAQGAAFSLHQKRS